MPSPRSASRAQVLPAANSTRRLDIEWPNASVSSFQSDPDSGPNFSIATTSLGNIVDITDLILDDPHCLKLLRSRVLCGHSSIKRVFEGPPVIFHRCIGISLKKPELR